MSVPETFKGIATNDPKDWDKPRIIEFKSKKFLPTMSWLKLNIVVFVEVIITLLVVIGGPSMVIC